jgi:hypothetical protein
MRSKRIARALSEMPVPDGAKGRERTLAAVRPGASREPMSPSPGRLLRPAFAIAVVAAIVAALFTPPGRAVAGWVGELIGVAEVGGPPTLEPSEFPHLQRRGPGFIAGTGAAPDGSRYELVAFDSSVGTCLELNFPDSRGEEPRVSTQCYRGSAGKRYIGLGTTHPREGSDLPHAIVAGEAGVDVERVEIRYRDLDGVSRTVEADVHALDGELLARVNGDEPIHSYVGFLDVGTSGQLRSGASEIEVVGYDAAGTEVARKRTSEVVNAKLASAKIILAEKLRELCPVDEDLGASESLPPRCQELLDREGLTLQAAAP